MQHDVNIIQLLTFFRGIFLASMGYHLLHSSATVETSTILWCRCACNFGMRRLKKAASTCTELPARRASPAWMCSETKLRTCAAHALGEARLWPS